MANKKIYLFIIAIIFLLPSFLFAATHYVASGGANSGEASWNAATDSGTPCCIYVANTYLTGGNKAVLQHGTYYIGNTDATGDGSDGDHLSPGIIPATSGSSGNRITYEADSGATVTFTGSSAGATAIYLENGRSYITVDGITSNNMYQHMWIYNGAYNEIANSTFSDMYDTTSEKYRGSTLQSPATYNWIHDCTFEDYGQYYDNDDHCVLFEIGYDSSGTDDVHDNVIEDCTFSHGGHHTLGIQGNKNVVRNNYFHNENWFDIDETLYGGRVFYGVGDEGDDEQNLIEGNRIAYGGQTSEPLHATGVGFLLSENYCIVRYNEFVRTYLSGIVLDPNHGDQTSKAVLNSIYNNTFWYCGYYEGSEVTSGKEYFGNSSTHAIVVDERTEDCVNNLIVNNIFYQNKNAQVANEDIIEGYDGDGWSVPDLQDIRGNWAGTDGDPKFTDMVGVPDPEDPDEYDFTLQSDSECIDNGTYLTQTNGAGTDSTALIVDNAYPFQDGWGNGAGGGAAVAADYVAVGTVSNTAQISSINYGTKTITLASALTWTDGQSVWLYKDSDGDIVLLGDAPDQGAHESLSDQTAPTYVSGEILANGTTFVATFSENLTVTDQEDDEFNLDCTNEGADQTLTYVSGSGTSLITFTIGNEIENDDTCNCDCVNVDADEYEDDVGNDLETFNDGTVTNNAGIPGTAVTTQFTNIGGSGSSSATGNTGSASFTN